MAIVTDYPQPDVKQIKVGNQTHQTLDPESTKRVIWRIWDAIHTLGGRGSSPPILQSPINMGSNRIFGVSNQDEPADDEVLTYGKAKSLYAPDAMAAALSVKGSNPLKLTNLRGQAAQPQLAWIPTVTPQFGKLPPFGSEMDGWAISDGSYIYQANGVTLEWGYLSALGSVIVGPRGAMGTPGAPNTLYVQNDTGWIYLANSTGTGYTFLVGITFGTDATRLGLTISAADNGAIFITTDTMKFWYVSGGSWAQINFGGSGQDFVLLSDGANPPNPVHDGAGNFVYVGYTP
jgi:hypothetical protein